MSTRLASFSTILALFFFLTPASLTAQVRPDQFDILGVKLGMPIGPELEKQIEALPDGFRCGQMSRFTLECRGRFNPAHKEGGPDQNTLDVYPDTISNNKVMLIQRWVKQGGGPTPENMLETLYKKYGQPPPSEVEIEESDSDKNVTNYRIFWVFDRKGNVVTKKGKRDSYNDNPCHRVEPNGERLNELCGVSLKASFSSDRDYGVRQYWLTLLDTRERYDRIVKEKREEEERKQKARLTTPSF